MSAGGVTLYGLRTCDTCRKALKSLSTAGCDATFHDLRADPVTRATLERWLAAFGEALVNRRSTTWRGLDEETRAQAPLDLLAAHPTLIKRPVTEVGDRLWLGWSAETADQVLAAAG